MKIKKIMYTILAVIKFCIVLIAAHLTVQFLDMSGSFWSYPIYAAGIVWGIIAAISKNEFFEI